MKISEEESNTTITVKVALSGQDLILLYLATRHGRHTHAERELLAQFGDLLRASVPGVVFPAAPKKAKKSKVDKNQLPLPGIVGAADPVQAVAAEADKRFGQPHYGHAAEAAPFLPHASTLKNDDAFADVSDPDPLVVAAEVSRSLQS